MPLDPIGRLVVGGINEYGRLSNETGYGIEGAPAGVLIDASAAGVSVSPLRRGLSSRM